MRYGKQYRFCPNCGRAHYDGVIQMSHVKSMCCNNKCRDEWERKYAASILGHDAEEPGNRSLESMAGNTMESIDGSKLGGALFKK